VTTSDQQFRAAGLALGWWFLNASRQDDQAANDFGYRWGGLGHDGFQQDGALECVPGPVGGGYDLRPGTFYRLNANLVINRNLSGYSGAHSDIHQPEVAWAAGLRP
jgi:hypothetical protein